MSRKRVCDSNWLARDDAIEENKNETNESYL